mmetsp:Transcript_86105/g.238616  ORF Transcript_86105/g.238616 Transcript_86105/m.238616 type:complete len:219 (+) Transcript_86105:476-1132(+)
MGASARTRGAAQTSRYFPRTLLGSRVLMGSGCHVALRCALLSLGSAPPDEESSVLVPGTMQLSWCSGAVKDVPERRRQGWHQTAWRSRQRRPLRRGCQCCCGRGAPRAGAGPRCRPCQPAARPGQPCPSGPPSRLPAAAEPYPGGEAEAVHWRWHAEVQPRLLSRKRHEETRLAANCPAAAPRPSARPAPAPCRRHRPPPGRRGVALPPGAAAGLAPA